MSTVRVSIEPSVLQWAVSRTGMGSEELHKNFPQIDEWRERKAKPTLRQAKKFAKKARVPFGRLLLDSPPGDEIDVASFRTVRNQVIETASPDLQEVLSTAQSRLAWYAEYAQEEGIAEPGIFGTIAPGEDPKTAAQKVRGQLGLKETTPIAGVDKVRTLTAAMESYGILVSRNSIVGNSTRRALDVAEFRGFTLEDGGFCLVYVNTRDAKTAQLFSLAHELGHVALGQAGVSDHSEALPQERWCNRFAAEFLAPHTAVLAEFDPAGEPLDETARLAKKFGISGESMVWRLVEVGLLDRATAEEIVGVFRNRAESNRGEDSQAAGAPPRHILVRSRVGERFYDTILHAADSGQIPHQVAARYLGAATYESFSKLLKQFKNSQQKLV